DEDDDDDEEDDDAAAATNDHSDERRRRRPCSTPPAALHPTHFFELLNRFASTTSIQMTISCTSMVTLVHVCGGRARGGDGVSGRRARRRRALAPHQDKSQQQHQRVQRDKAHKCNPVALVAKPYRQP